MRLAIGLIGVGVGALAISLGDRRDDDAEARGSSSDSQETASPSPSKSSVASGAEILRSSRAASMHRTVGAEANGWRSPLDGWTSRMMTAHSHVCRQATGVDGLCVAHAFLIGSDGGFLQWRGYPRAQALPGLQYPCGRRRVLASPRPNVRTDRDILESAARAVADQARKVDAVIGEAMDAGLDGSDPITVAVKMVRVELLGVKGELECQLARLVLDCRDCCRQVHWVPGIGSSSGTGRTASPRRIANRRCERPIQTRRAS